MRRVMTHGTFDLLHYGHISYLKRAKNQGDYLLVLLTSDEEAKRNLKEPYYNEDIRLFMVESIKYVDGVMLRDKKITQKDIIENSIDVFVASDSELGVFDFLKDVCEVVYIKRTEGISTTKIKNDLRKGVK